MNNLTTVQFLWRYMVHADEQILGAVRTVPEDGYRLEQNISLGSVEKLVDHVIAAQEAWMARFEGDDRPFPEFRPAFTNETSQRWAHIHQRLLTFADGQTSQSLQSRVTGRTRLGVKFELPVWAGMLHLADHSTYHRGQLNSMINRAGGQPSDVMLTRYAMATTHLDVRQMF